MADAEDREMTQLDRIEEAVGKLTTAQSDQGATLARLDERSKAQEKRLDRMDRRAMVAGALSGLGTALAAQFPGLAEALGNLKGGA